MQTQSSKQPQTSHISASLDEMLGAIDVILGHAYGHFKDLLLDSAFQPVYSIPHRRIVGHEGLLRATTMQGKPVPPSNMLDSVANDPESVFLDRLCSTVHMHNYQDAQTSNLWLFLNVSAQVIIRRRAHETFFPELLARYNFPPQQVVVEVVEDVIPDFQILTEAVKFYRDVGCVVAIDDFGAEASDIERIWRVSPDIVKLDRKLIVAAEFNPKARRVLQATVALIHETGSLALLEGVENHEQAIIAIDSNADLVQGFYFAKPAPVPLLQGDGGIGLLADSHLPVLRNGMKHQLLQAYILEFKCALMRLTKGQLLESSCSSLIALPRIDHCYVLSANGAQMGTSLKAQNNGRASRFAPLQAITGANWAHKPHHYLALALPGELQISHPYLSVISSRLCITLSASFQFNDETCVLCCDVEWLQ